MAIEVPAALREAVKKHKPLPVRHSEERAEVGPSTRSAQTRQHNTMLRLIGGLALATYGSLDKPYEVAKIISEDIGAKGIELSADTVASYLKEATLLLNEKSPPKP
jgi:dihydroxyacetone kinase